MPGEITTPAATAAVDRLRLAAEEIRGAGPSLNLPGQCMCPCLAEEAD